MGSKFDTFTGRARRVLTLAQEEAQRFNHNYIGTEHLLLGMLHEGNGVAARVLNHHSVTLENARAELEFIIGQGDRLVLGDIDLTPRARKVIELAADEARRLNHPYIGTEHLLPGLVREGEGIAAGILQSLGASLDVIQAETIRLITAVDAARAARGAVAPASPAVPPILPPEQFPERLAALGYVAHERDGVAYILPPLCIVPAGASLMGSDLAHDAQSARDERPQHPVDLPAYLLARYPVTVAEYACFVRAGQREPGDWSAQMERLDHPVVRIAWHDAVAYAAWLAACSGLPWRLPTEAEWEKAARWDGHTARIYPWGDTFDTARCNTSERGERGTTAVDAHPDGASPSGARDVAGNVWEWTSSLFMPYPYRRDDGREDADAPGSRVLRGGSWDYGARSARAAARSQGQPTARTGTTGFRLAVSLG